MKIIIDADACPVVDIAVGIAKKRNLKCILVCDNTHFIKKDGSETIIVDKGVDSTDCKIANLTEKGDVIIIVSVHNTSEHSLFFFYISSLLNLI
ncbi:MAG: DUF188 domain-containing protein [Acutalibacteraceae bacterium]|nr:DUF188 domain-containing protein [Acutalibacteraceae bacterium]